MRTKVTTLPALVERTLDGVLALLVHVAMHRDDVVLLLADAADIHGRLVRRARVHVPFLRNRTAFLLTKVAATHDLGVSVLPGGQGRGRGVQLVVLVGLGAQRRLLAEHGAASTGPESDWPTVAGGSQGRVRERK